MSDDKDQDKEKGIVMDTPERTQIANPLSKFEDSPVFNYINSLSPIKPVKSVHFTQAFSNISFASLPSVFTSPHVSSLRDSKFLRRHQFSDPSKPEHTSEDPKKAGTSEVNSTVAQNTLNRHTDFNHGNSITETSAARLKQCSNLESRKLTYEAVSPVTMNTLKLVGQSATTGPFINSENGPMGTETEIEVINKLHHCKEVSACDWDSLISDASELLNFDSPSDAVAYKGSGQKTLDPTSFNTTLMNEKPQTNDDNDDPLENNEGMKGAAENHSKIASTFINNFEVGEHMEDTDNEGGSNVYRGIRRRCLVFETMGSRRKHLEDISNGSSVNLPESNQTVVSSSNNLLPSRIRNDSSKCILPGIGLHLNAIASNLMDNKAVKHENSGSGRQLIISPSSAAFPSVGSGQEMITKMSDAPSFENDLGSGQNVAEDGSKALGFVGNDELSQSQTSPRKKRRRADIAGETEACKRCNCKKSKCLKLWSCGLRKSTDPATKGLNYCECFAAGVYCVEPCACHDCFNKPIHEDTVLATRKQIESRNPLAFAPKVIKTSDSIQEDESSNTPASARHKRGCNCKKSGCLKKYCECYQGGVGCSINCRCEGCKNTFGRKDGSEMDPEVNECEGNATDESLQMVLYNETEPVSATPATPSRFGRQSIPLPNSSKGKPPRSFLSIGSSSQRFGKLNHFKGGLNKQLQTVGENEIPDIFEETHGSPISGVKSCSPNSKRVSPPHSSKGQRSSRKLILQSIPSFPCLTPNPKQ